MERIQYLQVCNKIQKQLKNTLLKDLSPLRLKHLSEIFILNHFKNLIDHAKIYMTLLVPKIFQGDYFIY